MLSAKAQRGERDDATPSGQDYGARLDCTRFIDKRYCVSRGDQRATFDAEARAVSSQRKDVRRLDRRAAFATAYSLPMRKRGNWLDWRECALDVRATLSRAERRVTLGLWKTPRPASAPFPPPPAAVPAPALAASDTCKIMTGNSLALLDDSPRNRGPRSRSVSSPRSRVLEPRRMRMQILGNQTLSSTLDQYLYRQ
jgi:hypothetical protein